MRQRGRRQAIAALAVDARALHGLGETLQLRLKKQIRAGQVNGQRHAVGIDVNTALRREAVVAGAGEAEVAKINGALIGDGQQTIR